MNGHVAGCHYLRGWLELWMGNPAEAIDPLEQQLRITRTIGNRRDLGWSLRPVATALVLLGREGDAKKCIAEALAIFGELGDRSGQCLMHCLAALTDLSTNQHQSALAEINAARTLSRGISHPHTIGWVTLVLSAVCAAMAEGKWTTHLAEALAQLDQGQNNPPIFDLTLIGDVLTLGGAYSVARRYLQYALKYARRSGSIDRQHEICTRLARLRAICPSASRN